MAPYGVVGMPYMVTFGAQLVVPGLSGARYKAAENSQAVTAGEWLPISTST